MKVIRPAGVVNLKVNYVIKRYFMIAVIAAFAKNRVIGNKGKLIWNIPSDKKRFRKITEGNIVIMGRKTYEEIGSPLCGRINIVLSKSIRYRDKNLITAGSLDEAFAICNSNDVFAKKNIFICGGESIYREALDFADELYLSVLDKEYEGDVYFPEFDESLYKCVYKEYIEESIPYTFYRYVR